METVDRRDARHDRTLSIAWADGSSMRLTLDQGMGAWRADGRRAALGFSFAADVETQVDALLDASFVVGQTVLETPAVLEYPL